MKRDVADAAAEVSNAVLSVNMHLINELRPGIVKAAVVRTSAQRETQNECLFVDFFG